jgi:hypothetical protein
VTIHKLGCAECHGSSVAIVKAAIAAGGATCETCHILLVSDIHAPGDASHVVSGACYNSLCHARTDVADIHTMGDDPPGCTACHATAATPSLVCANCHANVATVHDFVHANASGTKSDTCTACHGTDLPSVHDGSFTGQANLGCFCHTGSLFNLSSTMAPLLAAGQAECLDCHKDPHAPHAFNMKASGHNTLTFGTVGAYTKWDGSEGVVVKDSTNTTITQEWPLPTSDVFWSQVDYTKSSPTTDAAPATANTTVGWDSVITCEDCHTGLNALEVAGPHGANVAANFGLDPNYPDDWTTAELTSFDPTGMRSIVTTMGSPNPYYPKLATNVTDGSLATVDASGNIIATATAGQNMVLMGKGFAIAAIGPSSPASQTSFYTKYVAGTNDASATASNGYSSGDIAGKFICQKCHKLVNPYQGIPGADGNGRGGRNNNLNYIGFGNEIHMEHHGNQSLGQANCISCHIAVPHGWKRPRLLVYSSDPAPYVVPQLPKTATVVANGVTYTNGGNWNYTGAGTQHLDGIDAAPTALKDLTAGGAVDFAVNDAANGTTYSLWSGTRLGTGWLADPNALPAADAVQNNCNACSQAGGTHTPAQEGFTTATPSWK